MLLDLLAPHRKTLLIIICLLLVGSGVTLLHPWLAGMLTKSILGDQAPPGTLQVLGLWVMVLVLRSIISFFTQYTLGTTGERITAQLRNRLYQHAQSLPLGYFQDRRPGETLSLLSTDTQIIGGFVTGTLVNILPAIATFVGALLLMLWTDSGIAMAVVVFLPAYFICIKLVGRQIRPLSAAWVQANSNLMSQLEEGLSLLPLSKAFNRQGDEQEKYEQANAKLLSLSSRQLGIQSALSPAVMLAGGAGLLALLGLGSARIDAGQLTPAELVSLLLYAMLLISPLGILANVYGQIQRTRGSLKRISLFLQELAEPSVSNSLNIDTRGSDIHFDDVSFHYEEGRPALTHLTLTVRAGETLAITGANGAGKSTLSYLLMRFADPTSGRICIGEMDIRQVNRESLRRAVGLVSQHTQLLNASIAQNIAYARPGASPEQIKEAAKMARAHDFICRLPQGYDTVIGHQGMKLSGGQRQRLSLARTLLMDPTVLILDEATALFDPAGEESFITHCESLLASRTVIIITHKPNISSLADRIIRLENGAVVSTSATSES